jgi:hypothetical protein
MFLLQINWEYVDTIMDIANGIRVLLWRDTNHICCHSLSQVELRKEVLFTPIHKVDISLNTNQLYFYLTEQHVSTSNRPHLCSQTCETEEGLVEDEICRSAK